MTITANGYIAKENNQTPWNEDTWSSYYRIARQYKAIIIGKKTYEIMKEFNDFEKIGNPFVIILSTSLSEKSDNLIVVKSIEETIKILNERGFKEVLICGGSKLNSSFLKENLMDEIILDIDSKIFGNGIPLFNKTDNDLRLSLISVKKISDKLYQTYYKVVKDAKDETTQTSSLIS